VAAIHANAEQFDPKAEAIFSYLQVLSCSLLPAVCTQRPWILADWKLMVTGRASRHMTRGTAAAIHV
jgi:hypothetical protein